MEALCTRQHDGASTADAVAAEAHRRRFVQDRP
jgi:hypothetical protein